jgi:hypothetical protein
VQNASCALYTFLRLQASCERVFRADTVLTESRGAVESLQAGAAMLGEPLLVPGRALPPVPTVVWLGWLIHSQVAFAYSAVAFLLLRARS